MGILEVTIKLLLATTNQGKTKEIQAYLSGFPVHIVSLLKMINKEIFHETGKTFLENAIGKSIFYSEKWKGLTLAEDSGLEIKHLEGSPGILSARFSGPQSTDKKNTQKVLKLMKNVPREERKARFVSCMVLSQKGKIIQEITAMVDGFISFHEKGSFGFGYDPIFFYPPLGKTFAELSSGEKNKVSHRGKALKKMKGFLKEYLS